MLQNSETICLYFLFNRFFVEQKNTIKFGYYFDYLEMCPSKHLLSDV